MNSAYNSSRPKNTSTESKKLEELLITEKFRQVLLQHKKADDYILDQYGYARVQGAVGFFRNPLRGRHSWIVYEVDGDGDICAEKHFPTQKGALTDAAKRRGVPLKLSDLSIQKNADGQVDIRKELAVAESARDFLKALSDFYEDEPEGVSARKDIELLDKIISSISQKTSQKPYVKVSLTTKIKHDTIGVSNISGVAAARRSARVAKIKGAAMVKPPVKNKMTKGSK